MQSLFTFLSASLGLIFIASPATALCKPAIGIEVHRDDFGLSMPCGRNDCNAPTTTITIYHDDHTTTSEEIGGTVSFGFSEQAQASVDEWDFFGKYRDDPGNGFQVYGTRCPALPSNQGFGCYEKAVKIERGHLPMATFTKWRCGTTW